MASSSAPFWADLPEGQDLEGCPIWPACFKQIRFDCAKFQSDNKELLEKAYRKKSDYAPYNAGRDFWLSRQGHGVNFMDRGLGEIGVLLDKAADEYGGMYVLPDAVDGVTWIYIE